MDQLAFPDHVFAAAIDTDLILFDSRADRYLALPGGLTAAADEGVDVGLPGVTLECGAAAALTGAGLTTSGERDVCRLVPLSRPNRMLPLLMPQDVGTSAADVIGVTVAVVRTGWRLKHGLPCRSFAHTRHISGESSPATLTDAVYRLRAARLLVPHPRRCLPASVVAAIFLSARGHAVDIVFGVRSHPFEAHCWVESNGLVLDDDLDRVRAYTPIAVGRL